MQYLFSAVIGRRQAAKTLVFPGVLRLMVSSMLLLNVACQDSANIKRYQINPAATASSETAWRNAVAGSLLADTMLQLATGAILAEESDAAWLGESRPLESLPTCASGTVTKETLPAQQTSWFAKIRYLGCAVGSDSLSGNHNLYFNATTDGIRYAQTLSEIVLGTGDNAVTYNGNSGIEVLWQFVEKRPTQPVWQWNYTSVYQQGDRSASSFLTIAGTYDSPDITHMTLAGQWQQADQVLSFSSSSLLLDFNHPSCLHSVAGNDGTRTALPYFPISFYSGSLNIYAQTDGNHDEWVFRECALEVRQNGSTIKNYDPALPEGRAHFSGSSGLLGTIPGRLSLRTPFLNLTAIKLLTRDWCMPEDCMRLRYDPLQDSAGAFWLRTGPANHFKSEVTENTKGHFEYNLGLLSQQVTKPAEGPVFGNMISTAVDQPDHLWLTPLATTDPVTWGTAQKWVSTARNRDGSDPTPVTNSAPSFALVPGYPRPDQHFATMEPLLRIIESVFQSE